MVVQQGSDDLWYSSSARLGDEVCGMIVQPSPDLTSLRDIQTPLCAAMDLCTPDSISAAQTLLGVTFDVLPNGVRQTCNAPHPHRHISRSVSTQGVVPTKRKKEEKTGL